MKTMNLEKITATMDKFEASFDKLDLTTSTMEGAMGSAMATSAPTSAVDALIRQVHRPFSKILEQIIMKLTNYQVADENELDVANMLDAAPEQNTRYDYKRILPLDYNCYSVASAQKQKENELEGRLAALRN